LIVQQNYFSDPYPAKILNLSGKPIFPYSIELQPRLDDSFDL